MHNSPAPALMIYSKFAYFILVQIQWSYNFARSQNGKIITAMSSRNTTKLASIGWSYSNESAQQTNFIEFAFASATHRKWHSTSIIFYLFARWISFAPSLFITLRSEIQFDCVDDWFHFKMTQLTLMWLRSNRNRNDSKKWAFAPLRRKYRIQFIVHFENSY